MRLFLLFLLFSGLLYADTYADYSYNVDTSAVTVHNGNVKANDHDRITINIIEDGILTISLSGSSTAKFAVSTSSMPDTKNTDPTLTTYGPTSYNSGDVIYVGANAPGDSSDESYSLTFTLIPLNSAPTDISLSSSTVSENLSIGTVVGALSSTDVDGGDTHTYSLVAGSGDSDNGSFNISGTNLITNAVFDYETDYNYSIRLESNDGNGGIYEESFTITIDDLVEGLVPTITTSQTFSVDENAANGTSVGTVATTNSPTSFSIISGNTDSIFSIDNLGEITVSDNTNLDYETTTSYTLEINASNVSGSDTENVTININDTADLSGINIPDFSKCGIFPSVLTSYQTINSNSQAQSVIDTDSIAATTTTNPNPTTMQCTDGATATCNVISPPLTTLTLPSYGSSSVTNTTLSTDATITALNADAYTINTNNLTITFNPNSVYDDDATKIMLIKALNVNGSDITYVFNEGDYFIDQWNFGTNTNIEVNGSVRLFFNSNMAVNNGFLNINAGGDVEDLFIFVDGTVNFPATFDVDGYIYSTSNFTANNHTGAQTLNGAITSEGDINLGASQVYTYDDSGLDSNDFGECSSAPTDSNSYGCDMFGSVIVTYDFLDVSSTANAQACGTENISYPTGQISGSIDCLSDIACGGTGAECERSDPPANKLTYSWTHPDDPMIANESPSPATLTDVSYGNVSYSGGSAAFNAATVNPYNGNNYMYIGSASFDQTLISFSSGDYYFESFTITKNKNDVNNFSIDATNGPVRIFIKNDLSFDLNNLYLNNSGNPSDLLIYVGGNYDNPGNGGGNTLMNGYFYVEGDVTLNNNSNNWIIEGGITSEGTITIAGNNPDFIESDEAGDLGYGACSICFQDVLEIASSPYKVDNSFVNLKGSTIYDLNVYKTYTGTNSRSGCTTTDGTCAQSSVTVDFDNLENFTYGNSYDGYQFDLGNYAVFQFSTIQDTNTHVFDITEYDTTARANNNVDIDVLYVADYYDQAANGKFYHTVIEACDLGSAGNNYIPGVLDAVDTNCTSGTPDTLLGCADNNISTKISGKTYDLNILDSNSSSDMLFGTALAYDVDGVMEYKYIGEINATLESGIITFTEANGYNPNNWSSISNTFATKEAWIQFYFCDSSPNWRDCYVVGGDNVYITKSLDANESSSLDKFSVRPKSFAIDLNATNTLALKAGNSYTIDANATYDSSNANTVGYTQTLSALSNKLAINMFSPLNPSCKLTSNENFVANFVDGNYSSTSFTYNNVGDINITLFDSSWTMIDQSNSGCIPDSNSTTSNPVGCNIQNTKGVIFVPDNFDINATLTNGADGFTYITDKNYTMAAELNITVTAQTLQGATTTNYNENCYAKATDYNMSYSTLSISPAGYLENIHYQEMNTSTEANSTIGNMFSITIPSSIFSTDTNGSASLNIKINFDRDKNESVNPFDLNITTIDMNDSDTSTSSALNQGARFIYGRTHAPRYRFDTPIGKAYIYYEVFCSGAGCDKSLLPNGSTSKFSDDPRWLKNESHLSATFGTAGTVSQKNATKVSVTVQPVGAHPDAIQVEYDESRGYPYKTTMQNSATSWLIYNKYNSSVITNEFEVEFEGGASEWSGAHETNTTTGETGAKKTNRRSMW